MKTTAISKQNAAVDLSSSRVGNIRYITKGGKTYTRTVASSAKDPRTEPQMRVRTRVANITTTYRAVKPLISKCFENATSTVSKYNLYYKKATQCEAVYLTKQQAAVGCQVAAPYGISEGSLKSIKYALNTNGILQSNIGLGAGFTITAATTVGELAQAIVDHNNKVIKYGDYISFIKVLQSGDVNYPYVDAVGYNIRLVRNSPELVLDKVSAEGFSAAGGYLAMADEPEAGCYAWIHSRKEGGSVKVSTQDLYNANEEFLAYFSSDDAFESAAYSYGEMNEDPFVVSDSGESDEPGPGPIPPTPTGEFTLTVKVHDGQTQMGKIKINGGEGKTEDSITVESGTQVTVQAVPTPGGEYHFVGWNDGQSDLQRTVTVTESKTLVASFEPEE